MTGLIVWSGSITQQSKKVLPQIIKTIKDSNFLSSVPILKIMQSTFKVRSPKVNPYQKGELELSEMSTIDKESLIRTEELLVFLVQRFVCFCLCSRRGSGSTVLTVYLMWCSCDWRASWQCSSFCACC